MVKCFSFLVATRDCLNHPTIYGHPKTQRFHPRLKKTKDKSAALSLPTWKKTKVLIALPQASCSMRCALSIVC